MKYTLWISENGERIDDREIPDPFIHTTIIVHGWRSAWRCLTGSIRLVVRVDGDKDAIRHVMMPRDVPLVDGPSTPGGR